jgi:gliding motility-associated-like protein
MLNRIFTFLIFLPLLTGWKEASCQTNLPYNQVSQNQNWVFGIGLGVSFNSGAPVITTSNASQFQGYSSISDNTGQLLMYADLDTVWNKNGTIMPNGNGLLPFLPLSNVSGQAVVTPSDQGSLIVPFIKNPLKYYVFSQTSFWGSTQFQQPGNDPKAGRLYYSVVDMSLNGGLGDVVPGQKGIQLDSLLGDRMVAVKGSNCNVWLLTMKNDGSAIHAFEITPAGINPAPVVSVCQVAATPTLSLTGLLNSSSAGQMLVSPDNQKLAIALNGMAIDLATFSFYGGAFELYDFNNSTGQLSNQINILPPSSLLGFDQLVYSLCFSPDNTKLYAAHGFLLGYGLSQYNITAGNAAAILATKTELNTGLTGWGSGMRLGPDDKIYVSGINANVNGAGGTALHRIDFPNLAGAASSLTLNALPLPAGSKVLYSLGAATVNRPPSDSVNTTHTLALCSYEPQVLLSVPLDASYTYLWNNGAASNTFYASQPGTYWVNYGDRCFKYSDTFNVLGVDLHPDLGPDKVVCGVVEPFELNAPLLAATTYQWQDGSTQSHYTVTDTGMYYVTMSKMGCVGSDTIKVFSYDVFQDLGEDVTVCEGKPFSIPVTARVPDGATVQWSTGQTTAGIVITKPGTYTVMVSQDICSGEDSITVTTELCDCFTFTPTAFSPNGDGLNDVFLPGYQQGCLITGYSLSVYNRYGQRVFHTEQVGKGWDGTMNGTPADAGTYMFTISYDKGTQHNAYTVKGDITLVR